MEKSEKAALEKAVAALKWRHTIDLGNGIVTHGQVDPRGKGCKLEKIRLPEDLSEMSVLDVGAWTGFYSFEAEKSGAKRVVALDSDKWAWHESRDGRAAFLLARKALNSKVEDITMDAEDISPETVGMFDIVLFLGVFYHLRYPRLGLERVASVTRHLLIVETATGAKDLQIPAMEFRPKGKGYNQWFPNVACVHALLHDAGFPFVETVHTGNRSSFHARKTTDDRFENTTKN